MKKPSAILTSDWHLRETTPTCRTDDFWKAQWDKVDWIAELQKQYDCPVLHAGDLFHHWKPSPFLLSMTIKHLPDKFVTIYGQHDLPQHSLELKEKSGIYVLEKAEKVITDFELLNNETPFRIVFASWGKSPNSEEAIGIQNVLLWHNFTYVGKEPWPGCSSPKAHALLHKYKQFDLILTGDNHQSFTSRGIDDNLLVNPGSLMRQSADQIDFKPKVYLWYAKTNTVEAIEVPIEKGVISREHIEVKQDRDDRIDAFISRLDTDWKMTMDFDKNLAMFFSKNRVRREVKEIINEAKEEKV